MDINTQRKLIEEVKQDQEDRKERRGISETVIMQLGSEDIVRVMSGLGVKTYNISIQRVRKLLSDMTQDDAAKVVSFIRDLPDALKMRTRKPGLDASTNGDLYFNVK